MTERRIGLQEFSFRTASSVALLLRCTVLKLPVWVREICSGITKGTIYCVGSRGSVINGISGNCRMWWLRASY